MAVRRRGNTFQADFMIKGKRYRETFDTENAAKRWEMDTKEALAAGKPIPSVNNGRADSGHKIKTLQQLFEHVCKTHWKLKRSSETLIQSGKQCVDILGANFEVSEFSRLQYDLIIAELSEQELSNATINRKLAAMSVMIRAAVEIGALNRAPKVPLQEEGLGRTRFLTVDEETKLLKLFEKWGMDDVRAFTIFALDTGGRLSAMLGLGWGDFGEKLSTVTYWKDKKSPPRTLPLTERSKDELRKLKERYPDEPGPFRMFRSKNGVLRTHWDRAMTHLKLDDVVIHTLRHTCASRLVQRSVDLRRVQQWMGHRSIQTTLRYAHLAPSDLLGMAGVLEQHTQQQAVQAV
ncbi:site-specific integrase [Neorhizobium sp. S3-V5DH]|uniref:tyrosine-type recombinase/integrase n=1 Tax=Neorhizobium sp. S3-V5DH TaxID=2485166 RepID=UPI0010464CB2|nr:site-specific integrase [Neorhizobium sp. S3-V5DH]TCV62283.1 site-specific recombinase XerD [Neorhizobium sp. S3-V5DH]